MEGKVDKRKNGIYYTPQKLAQYLADPLINGKNMRVFDPAYGEGSLLLATELIFKSKNKANSTLELFGCDIHPVNGLLTHLPKANLKQSDFFNVEDKSQFDVIISNPPYVRHQNQARDQINEYRKKHDSLKFLSNSSDLWAYFLIKSISHLKNNGSIGLILPWAFLQADYAQNIRNWLLNKFKKIKVLALNHPYFEAESAQERVVIVWLFNKDHMTSKIEFAFANDINNEISYRELKINEWNSNKVIGIDYNLDLLYNKLLFEFGFLKLGEIATIRIGIVTGANSFFIRNKEELSFLGFKNSHLVPIISLANELPIVIKEGSSNLKRLVCISEKDKINYSKFIESGEILGFDKRSHSKQRKSWFSVSQGKVPDAFFPYRVGKIPYLVINKNSIQSTNSIHRIYFKGEITEIEKKWITISMLSIYGQLSIEINAKTYGRGMLKMEPGALAKVIVFKSNNDQINSVYDMVLECLIMGDKESAVILSTDFIDNALDIPDDLKNDIKSAYENLKNIRKRN